MSKATVALICVLSAVFLLVGGGLMITGPNKVLEHWGVEAIEAGKLMFVAMFAITFFRATEPDP